MILRRSKKDKVAGKAAKTAGSATTRTASIVPESGTATATSAMNGPGDWRRFRPDLTKQRELVKTGGNPFEEALLKEDLSNIEMTIQSALSQNSLSQNPEVLKAAQTFLEEDLELHRFAGGTQGPDFDAETGTYFTPLKNPHTVCAYNPDGSMNWAHPLLSTILKAEVLRLNGAQAQMATLVSQRQSELLEGYKTDVLTSINALEQTTHSAMSPLKEKGRRRKLEALQTELGLVHNSQAALEQEQRAYELYTNSRLTLDDGQGVSTADHDPSMITLRKLLGDDEKTGAPGLRSKWIHAVTDLTSFLSESGGGERLTPKGGAKNGERDKASAFFLGHKVREKKKQKKPSTDDEQHVLDRRPRPRSCSRSTFALPTSRHRSRVSRCGSYEDTEFSDFVGSSRAPFHSRDRSRPFTAPYRHRSADYDGSYFSGDSGDEDEEEDVLMHDGPAYPPARGRGRSASFALPSRSAQRSMPPLARNSVPPPHPDEGYFSDDDDDDDVSMYDAPANPPSRGWGTSASRDRSVQRDVRRPTWADIGTAALTSRGRSSSINHNPNFLSSPRSMLTPSRQRNSFYGDFDDDQGESDGGGPFSGGLTQSYPSSKYSIFAPRGPSRARTSRFGPSWAAAGNSRGGRPPPRSLFGGTGRSGRYGRSW